MDLIVLYGPPCGGKTVLSRLLVQKYGFTYLSTDRIREEIFFGFENVYGPHMVERVYTELRKQIKIALSCNSSVLVEGMFLKSYRREEMLENLDKASVKFVYITASLDVLLKRLAVRDGKNEENVLHKKEPLSPEALADFYHRSQPPLDVRFIVDTTTDSIDTSLRKAEMIIEGDFGSELLIENFVKSDR